MHGWPLPSVDTKRTIAIILMGLSIYLGNSRLGAVAPPLRPVPVDAIAADPCCAEPLLGQDDAIWPQQGQSSDAPREMLGERATLLRAIDHSLQYLASDRAVNDYQKIDRTAFGNPSPAALRSRVRRSLQRFRQLVLTQPNARALQRAVAQEFIFYQAIGQDGQGTVGFTGYFEPTYRASRVPTVEYRYPLFRRPPTLEQWSRPHPTRLQLEGADGLQFAQGPLRGLELVWLRDRLEAFLVQVQGSARLQLTDGRTLTVGYAGRTDYPYVGIGRELVDAGKFTLEELTLPRLVQYFREHPDELDLYLPRNQRFVFFKETHGAPATGSIGVPVLPGRSIATDKTLFPPGALALIHTPLPTLNRAGQLEQRLVSRYVLDQDTGGAIKGPGRVDVFMGTGQAAGDRAGLVNATGQLYYLLLRE
ncbi:MltA domain-containing protein [Trichothermofontia sichuanensis B231]|uniref:murein transglycosylase A n=1 Tax=Trichothermofontia sichuanensis TaxID=3045816 RepID=UPI0022461E43|nr:MltA domain-containing protein [Trichothermofontia sichuanensis]UZQ54251.1 MltA domain-containing protein [Trichothermofontia sichuanensis B231]